MERNKKERLFDAIDGGDLNELLACVADGVDITELDGALELAAWHGNVPIARELLSGGADVDERDRELGRTPLHTAVMRRSEGVCQLLLSAGADAGAVDVFGVSPLHAAAWAGSVECIAQLLDAGADVNARTYNGNTAVAIALSHGFCCVASSLRAAARWAGLRRAALSAWCCCQRR